MATVAEGIETFEQLKLVCATGCSEAQGLYFSAPVAAHEAERVLNGSFAHARNAA
jgi:EAL domain-containing protein (putative c-di-GMP-specific phosphodiesterase class I)